MATAVPQPPARSSRSSLESADPPTRKRRLKASLSATSVLVADTVASTSSAGHFLSRPQSDPLLRGEPPPAPRGTKGERRRGTLNAKRSISSWRSSPPSPGAIGAVASDFAVRSSGARPPVYPPLERDSEERLRQNPFTGTSPTFETGEPVAAKGGSRALAMIPPSASLFSDDMAARKRHRRKQKKRHQKVNPGENGLAEDDTEASSADESGPLLASVSLAEGETGGLDEEIKRLYAIHRASPEALAAREDIIARLNNLFNNASFIWGHPHSSLVNPLRVEPFGSVRFGLATSSSDLDLCLFDPYNPNGFDRKVLRSNGQGELSGIYNMRVIAAKLGRAGFKNVLSIPHAAVPIVKFEATYGNEVIKADLNTNERFGVLNSRLIAAYADLSPVFRPLSVFIKFWAKQRQLNDSSGSNGPVTFSSYTLILLVIAFLQHRRILPNLQSDELIALHNVPRTVFWSRPKRGHSRKNQPGKISPGIGWDTTFVEKLDDWHLQLDGTEGSLNGVAELAKGFFEYYGSSFDMDRFAVAIQLGRPLLRELPYQILAEGVKEVLTANAAKSESGTAEGGQDKEGTMPEDSDDLERVQSLSRSSSPVAYGEFAEPKAWATQQLVVQDPFILTRNTAQNVKPDVVDFLCEEMRRAAGLIAQGAPLAEICAPIKLEEGYRSLAKKRQQDRRRRGKQIELEKKKLLAATKREERKFLKENVIAEKRLGKGDAMEKDGNEPVAQEETGGKGELSQELADLSLDSASGTRASPPKTE